MRIAAAAYTLASVAVLALMITRPPVQVASSSVVAPASASTPMAVPAPEPMPSAASTPLVTPAPEAGVTPVTPEGQPGQVVTLPDAPPKPLPDASALPDYEREQRLASEIRDTIMEGQVISLNDGTRDFMAIYTPAEQARGAVIILHGRGYHPDWEDVVHPLRVGLVSKGWSTLSLQMPVLEKEAKYYDYVPLFANADKRIDAGIAYLKQQGVSNIVLAAHSCGAHMAMNWLNNKGDADLAAVVGLGIGATDYGQELVQPFPLAKLKVPVLDVYAEQDFPQVLKLAPERQAMLQQAGNPHSTQMMLPAAEHYFKEKGDELTAIVANWLNSLPM